MDQIHDMELKGSWADDVEFELEEQEMTHKKQESAQKIKDDKELLKNISQLAIRNFVPGGLIRFLPEKLRIRLDPSCGWELRLSDNPPAPPRYEEPGYGEVKVGLTIDDYDPRTSVSLENIERNYQVNIPVYLTASENRDLIYVDSNRRPVPEEFIHFDRDYKNTEVRLEAHSSLLNKHDLKQKQAEEAYIDNLRQWRVIRRYKEHSLAEREWEGGNFSIFHPDVTKEDFQSALQYIQKKNQLDMEGKIDDWSTGDFYTSKDRALEAEADPNVPGDTTSQTTGTRVKSYAEALVKGTPEPSKFELDAQRQKAIAAWKKAKKQRRNEKRKIMTRGQIKGVRLKAITEKRNKGIVPENPCPLCNNKGHWKIDCPDLPRKKEPKKEEQKKCTKEPKSAKKPEINKVQNKKKMKNKKQQSKIRDSDFGIDFGDGETGPTMKPKGSKKGTVLAHFGSSITGS